jgi:hypothetical protein
MGSVRDHFERRDRVVHDLRSQENLKMWERFAWFESELLPEVAKLWRLEFVSLCCAGSGCDLRDSGKQPRCHESRGKPLAMFLTAPQSDIAATRWRHARKQRDLS